MRKVAIIGSRRCMARRSIQALVMSLWGQDAKIISGGASGADTIAAEFAQQYKIPIDVYKPDYDAYGPKLAPIRRNDQIVEAADEVRAYWDGISRGTEYTIRAALRARKPVTVYHLKDDMISIARVDASCSVCKGSGADPASDNVDWLPCQACYGRGMKEVKSCD